MTFALWRLTTAAKEASHASEPLRFQGVAVQPRYRTSLPQHRDSTGYVKEHAQVRLAARVFRSARVRATRAGSPRRRGRSIVLQEPCQPMPESCKSLKLQRNFFFEVLARKQPCETIAERSTCCYCSGNADCPRAM